MTSFSIVRSRRSSGFGVRQIGNTKFVFVDLRPILAMVLVVLAAIILAGCGGSASLPNAPTPVPEESDSSGLANCEKTEIRNSEGTIIFRLVEFSPGCGGAVKVETIPRIAVEFYQDVGEDLEFFLEISMDGEFPFYHPNGGSWPFSLLAGKAPRGQWVRRDLKEVLRPGVSADFADTGIPYLLVWLNPRGNWCCPTVVPGGFIWGDAFPVRLTVVR